MDTLEEIEQREYARKDRAWRFQRASGERDRLTREIERLTPQVDQLESVLQLIEQVRELAQQLPGDVIGTQGLIARDQIVGACLAAKRSETRRLEHIKRSLADAEAKLPHQEATIAAIEAEEAACTQGS